MSSMKHIDLQVNITTPDDIEKDIKQLLPHVIEDFAQEKVEIELLTGGYVNKVYKISHDDVCLLVRVFTMKTYKLTRLETVVIAMRAAEKAGVGAAVLASFTNGIVHGHVPGEVANPENTSLNNTEFIRAVIKKVAAFNNVDASLIEVKGELLSRESRFEHEINRIIGEIKDDFDGSATFGCDVPMLENKAVIIKEAEWINSIVKSLDLPLVFTHGDLWWSNIIYNPTTGDVSFVDFDTAGYNPFPVDLVSIMAFLNMKLGKPDTMESYSEDDLRLMCKVYIEEIRRLENRHTKVTIAEVDILYAISRAFKVYVMFSLMIFCTYTSFEDEPFKRVAINFEKFYRKSKDEFLEYRTSKEDLLLSCRHWKP